MPEQLKKAAAKASSLLRFPFQARKRYTLATAFLVVTVFLVTLANLESTESDFKHAMSVGMGLVLPDWGAPNAPEEAQCLGALDYLDRDKYDLSPSVLYQKRCIRAVQDGDSGNRHEVANISDVLIGESTPLYQNKSKCNAWVGEPQPECKPFELQVPPPYPNRRYPHIIFGVATSTTRLEESLSYFSHWLGRSGSPLLAVVVDANGNGAKLEELKKKYRKNGINLIPVQPWNEALGPNEQHFTILRDLIRHATPYTEWVAIIDDDTFFPSLFALSEALAQHDPKKALYIGGVSESSEAIRKHGIMAYGGAGVFLSVPMAAELETHLEECVDESETPQGDGLLFECIEHKTDVNLTALSGLHQVDMFGDCSGFYESGELPISLHHWKSWHSAPVDKMAKISWFCGDCFLQRWRFGDNVVLSNGFSIAVYEDGTGSLPLEELEGTWDGALDIEWGVGPIRSKVDEGRKKSFRLFESEQVGNSLRQLYAFRADRDEGGARQDEVIELWWEW